MRRIYKAIIKIPIRLSGLIVLYLVWTHSKDIENLVDNVIISFTLGLFIGVMSFIWTLVCNMDILDVLSSVLDKFTKFMWTK